MKYDASLLALSVLAIGGVPSSAAQTAGASYGEPGQDVPDRAQAAPVPAPPMIPPLAGDGPRATSGETESRYDEVGFASISDEVGSGAQAAHPTLPIGSFVEVTALDTGRTIVLEIGKAASGGADRLIVLSPGAVEALGTQPGPIVAVRVRQVTPSPQDVASIRAGVAPTRLDAPQILLTALRKQLPGDAVPAAAPPNPGTRGTSIPMVAAPPPPKTPTAPAAAGRYRVQVATFSTDDRARALATKIDGRVEPSGKYFRVQLGPFATEAEAKRARDRVARQGYGDARTITTD